MKNQYRGGNCLKRGGGLGQFADLGGGGLGKKEAGGGFWEEGGDTLMHTMSWLSCLRHSDAGVRSFCI